MQSPNNYECPFCKIVNGRYDGIATVAEDVLIRGEHVTAFVSSHQWPDNKGHVIIITNNHYENLYSLPNEMAIPIQEISKTIAMALKSAFECPGISTRQHNEPAGGQDVWHYHLHVFPRYDSDNLYGAAREKIEAAERNRQASFIRQALHELGSV